MHSNQPRLAVDSSKWLQVCVVVSMQIACNSTIKQHQLHGHVATTQLLCMIETIQHSTAPMTEVATPMYNSECTSSADKSEELCKQPEAARNCRYAEVVQTMPRKGISQHKHPKNNSAAQSVAVEVESRTRQLRQPVLQTPQLNRDMVIELFEHLETFKILADAQELEILPPILYANDRRRSLHQEVKRNSPRTHHRSASCGHLEFYTG